MFGKIFESIYDGSLHGDWKALVVFQQLIVLCDSDGVIDATTRAIAARTGIPIEIINEGIEALEQPDDESRSREMEGRRIVRLDDHRSWGWQIVNHAQYRDTVSKADARTKAAERTIPAVAPTPWVQTAPPPHSRSPIWLTLAVTP